MKKILLTPDQEHTIKSIAVCAYHEGNYYYIPTFYKELSDGMYEMLTWDELPEGVKEFILQQKGIKLPSK